MLKNNLKKYLIYFSLLGFICTFLPIFSAKKQSAFSSDPKNNTIEEVFVITPTDIDSKVFKGPPWPEISRPKNIFGFFLEHLKDRKAIQSEKLGPLYFASKRTVILEKYYDKIPVLGNFSGIVQLENWWKNIRPKSWEFWKFGKIDSWEASLAEYYVLMREEIKNVDFEVQNEKNIQKIFETRKAIFMHKEKILKAVKSLPESESKYLFNLIKEIFLELDSKSSWEIPNYNKFSFFYSFFPLLKNSHEGTYQFLLSPLELISSNAKFEVENQPSKLLNINGQKKIDLGKYLIDSSSRWAVLEVSENDLTDRNDKFIPPKIKISKISNISNDKISIENSLGAKPNNFLSVIRISFAVLFFSLILNLIDVFKSMFKIVFKKIIRFLCFFYSKKKFIFLLIYAIGIIFCLTFINNFFDIAILWTIFFWLIILTSERLGSSYSLLVSLVLVIVSPIFILSGREIYTEMIALAIFMFIFAATIQMFFQPKKMSGKELNWAKLYYTARVKYMVIFISFILILLIIKSLRGEIIFYKYFFEEQFLNEFIHRLLWKIIIFDFIIIFFVFFKFLDQFKPKFMDKNYEWKIIQVFTAVFLIMIVNKIVSLNERDNFSYKPYINKIILNKDADENTLQIFGHNFLDVPYVGKVKLEGEEMRVKEWKDWRIIIYFDRKISENSSLVVSNKYDRYEGDWQVSNEYKLIIK